MAGREVREYTNLSDPRDKKWGGKGSKDKVDDEDIAFKKMVAKVMGRQLSWIVLRTCPDREFGAHLDSVTKSRCRMLQGNVVDTCMGGAEQMEAEADAERLRRRTEKRAFAAFKKAASLADASHLSKVPALRVEPKPRSGIRQQDFLKNIVEVKAKRHRLDAPAQNSNVRSSSGVGVLEVKESSKSQVDHPIESKNSGALLGLTYETSDDESSS